jgi:hypothetical protein
MFLQVGNIPGSTCYLDWRTVGFPRYETKDLQIIPRNIHTSLFLGDTVGWFGLGSQVRLNNVAPGHSTEKPVCLY